MSQNNHGKYSIEELLSLTNYQLMMKWPKLAALIRHNEYNESNPKDWSKGWHPSREKAIYLISTGKAEEYINAVRAQYNQGTPIATTEILETPAVAEQITETPEKKKVPKRKLSVYQKNYKRLLRLLPDFEDRLINDDSLQAISNATGYEGIILITPLMQENHLAVLEIYHFLDDGKNYRVNTLQVVEIDVARATLKPLIYQDRDGSRSIDHSVAGVANNLVDIKERKRQNKFIKELFENLLYNKHKFSWDEDADEQLIKALRARRCKFEPDHTVEDSIEENNSSIINLNGAIDYLTDVQRELDKKIKKERKERESEVLKIQQQADHQRSYNAQKLTFNNSIPDYVPGEVEFLDVHRSIGIAQSDIDRLNEEKTSLHFFPRPEDNLAGFTLMATGKVRFA